MNKTEHLQSLGFDGDYVVNNETVERCKYVNEDQQVIFYNRQTKKGCRGKVITACGYHARVEYQVGEKTESQWFNISDLLVPKGTQL